jgi:hypothetical protein
VQLPVHAELLSNSVHDAADVAETAYCHRAGDSKGHPGREARRGKSPATTGPPRRPGMGVSQPVGSDRPPELKSR